MNKRILATATFFAALAVILGAFGAHGLKSQLSVNDLENWKTGVSYQFYHALALLFLSIIAEKGIKTSVASVCFSLGIIFFSGSLYLLSTRSITGLGVSFIGPITPVGGLFFIAGWISLLMAALRRK